MDALWKKFRGKTHHVDQDARQKGLQQMLQFKTTVQHGFPNRPSALAYDPNLRIVAIGTQSGSVKIYGSPGVECYAQHDADIVVNHIVFLPNQGRFVTVCEDNVIYLWEIACREKVISVECINNVKFEGRLKKVSAVWLSSVGDQLYFGTEGGNVHVLNYNTFEFTEASTIYIDNATQNSASPSRASPGAVEAIAENPVNSDEILIGYNKGLVVLWDSREQKSIRSFWAGQQLESLCWSSDGSRFFSSHNDGSYITWDPQLSEPIEKPNFPYGPFPCKPIPKLLWKTSRGSHPFNIFSGGMPRSRYGDHQTVTVMHGEKHVVFDFTSRVVDFFTVDRNESIDHADPEALIVLLEEELIAIDLTADKWPIFQLPYLYVMHSSSITCSHHVSNLSNEFWDALTSAGRQQEKGYFSIKSWPITGGQTSKETNDNHEVFLTGHEDGSVRFWDVSGHHLRILYTLKTVNLFKTDDMDGDEEEAVPSPNEEDETDEWPPFRKTGSFDPFSDDPRLAVQKMEFCAKTNTLLLAGTSGQIIVFDFKKIPSAGKTMDHVTVNLVGDRDGFVWKGHTPLKLKTSVIKSEIGFQPHTVVQIMPPAACTALALHSEWQLFGVGTAHGFILMDYNRRKAVAARCTLQTMEGVNGVDPAMTRRKSFKKSLRESFRRMRRGRSQMATKRGPDGDKASPSRDAPVHIEARPVEREIEFRAVDNEMGSVVRCLQLVSCYILNNVVSSPTFWVGTNSGGVLIYTLVLPLAENRREEEVHASLSKEIQLQHHAPVVHIAVIDAHGCPVNEKPLHKDSGGESSQKVVICSEEQFKIFHLPSLKPYTKFKLTASEGALVRKVRIVRFAGRSDEDVREYCLACLTNQGDINIFSLPGLQRLLKQECIRRENIHGITTLTFTKTGQGFYQKSPSEFQRFTLTARNVMDPLCIIDIPDHVRLVETPRPPHSPLSHTSNSSPKVRSLNKSSPESGISVNNHVYARTTVSSGMRSPDTLNLNESIKSETSGEDSIRIYPSDGQITMTHLRSPDPHDRVPSS